MIINLLRDTHNEFGTFGTLKATGLSLFTVEQDWENNIPYKSCYPNGEYVMTFHKSPRHGECYIIENLALGVGKDEGDARRFGCLFHKANLASQLEGCTAPGLRRGFYKGKWSVSSSGDAMKEMFKVLGKDSKVKHRLIVTSNFPTFEVTNNV